MATQENVRYWRLYLYLHEGVSFLFSRYILSREQKHGKDLFSLLLENEEQLKRKKNLDEEEKDLLFPDDGKPDMSKWDANIYLTLIQTVFQTSLTKTERKELKNIKTIHEDLCKSLDESYNLFEEYSYEDNMEILNDAFQAFAFDDHSKSKILQMRNFYVDTELDSSTLHERVNMLNFPSDAKQQLTTFLKAISSTNTSNEVLEEDARQFSGMNLNLDNTNYSFDLLKAC